YAACVPLVFGAMGDKDAAGMLRQLAPVVSTFVLTRPSGSRSADPVELAAVLRGAAPHAEGVVEPVPAAALNAAWRLSRRIVAAGSIVLLGDLIVTLDRP